jgi:hypothetical protein
MRTPTLRLIATMRTYWLYVAYLSQHLVKASADCYQPNGARLEDSYYQPCSNDSSKPLSSICCATGRSNPDAWFISTGGLTSDVCLSNGICMNRARENETEARLRVIYYREGCTTRDWKSGKCLDVCVDNVCGFPKPQLSSW